MLKKVLEHCARYDIDEQYLKEKITGRFIDHAGEADKRRFDAEVEEKKRQEAEAKARAALQEMLR